MVRAKFKVDAIERTMGSRGMKDADGKPVMSEDGRYQKHEPCEMSTIKMSPVYANNDPNHENSKFWAASPGGSLALNCVNAAAVAELELGKEYYIDFTKAGE